MRKEVDELVAKNRGAAWFQNDHRSTGIDLLFESSKDLLEIVLGLVEHSIVVERPAAAQLCLRNRKAESHLLQDVGSSHGRFWEEVIVEGVRPEQHFEASGKRFHILFEPRAEGVGRKFGDASLERHAGGEF